VSELKLLLVMLLGVWTLILFAFLIYLGWVYLELKRLGGWRPPEVPRDGAGRALKERK